MVGLEVMTRPSLIRRRRTDAVYRFEYRRNMQEVLPNVFLGPLQISRSNPILQANRISLLVPVRTPNTARFLSVPNDQDGKPWPAFPIDILHDQIMGWFYKTFLRVKEEVDKGGRVFIYCENGNGLSAAICVALVMDTRLYGIIVGSG
jgi:serine/threonine/tyrosine-interacting protein